MPGITETVVRKYANPFGQCEEDVRLRSLETYREAALLFDLAVQYGPNSSVRLHGLCENSTSEATSIVMEKLMSARGRLRMWRQQVSENETTRQIRKYAERLGSFSAGSLLMLDSKWDNVGLSRNGQIHALDAGDFRIFSNTRRQLRQVELLGHTLHFHDRPLPERSSHCPGLQPIHLPSEVCAGLRDVRQLGRGANGVIWEATLPGRERTVVRKTALNADPVPSAKPHICGTGDLRRFELYHEATMLANLQAHYYGANETARFYGVCDNNAGVISVVLEKLPAVQNRWLSCLLKRAWTPDGWADLDELRRHGCRSEHAFYYTEDGPSNHSGCEMLHMKGRSAWWPPHRRDGAVAQWCIDFHADPAGCNRHIVTFRNGSYALCDYRHAPPSGGNSSFGCFPRYPFFSCPPPT